MLPFLFPEKPFSVTPEFVATLRAPEHIVQPKYDGYRLLILHDEAGTRLQSRDNRPMEQAWKKFPVRDFLQAVAQLQLPLGTVLDAELMGPRGGHVPAAHVFDCLAWDGSYLIEERYEQRFARCQSLPQVPMIDVVQSFNFNTASEILQYFEQLKSDWLKNPVISYFEGIVIKHRLGKLRLDRRACLKSDSAYKLKYRDIKEEKY